MAGLPRLQFLTLDAAPLSHRDQALAALQGGVRWIQFRTKTLPEAAAIEEAARIAELCRDYGATSSSMIRRASPWPPKPMACI